VSQVFSAARTDVLAAFSIRTSDDPLEKIKLQDAATQFESILIASLLEKFEAMTEAPGEASADAGGNTMHAVGVQAFASKLAESGGFGIAKLLIEKACPAEGKVPLSTKVLSSCGR
jgi:Rod binding domain-containing protein